ncbi:MAG: hypothetical protein COA73_01490 [Candidatus Hydrogenedentota bacterium]|nr:MAG: hypothetical protein COA73_01490 [Candidatus Hydrogenedentota bacterium]
MAQLQLTSILVYVKPEQTHSFAVQKAIEILGEAQGVIKVVTAFEPPPSWLSTVLINKDLEKAYLKEVVDTLKHLANGYSHYQGDIKTHLLRGRPYMEIVREVIRSGPDIVMIDDEGSSSDDSTHISGLDWRLFRKCPCPVWLIQPPNENKGIAVALTPEGEDEGIELNRRLLESAMCLAENMSQDLHVIQAWEEFGHTYVMKRTTQAEYEQYMKNCKVKVAESLFGFLEPYGFSRDSGNVHLVEGAPEKVIPRTANKLTLDTLVIGTIARSGIAGHLLGNTAERIIDKAECSIFAMKPEGWKSPIEV